MYANFRPAFLSLIPDHEPHMYSNNPMRQLRNMFSYSSDPAEAPYEELPDQNFGRSSNYGKERNVYEQFCDSPMHGNALASGLYKRDQELGFSDVTAPLTSVERRGKSRRARES